MPSFVTRGGNLPKDCVIEPVVGCFFARPDGKAEWVDEADAPETQDTVEVGDIERKV